MGTMLVTNIRRLRKEQNMTQMKLASAVGVSQAFICALEKGERCPSLGVAVRVAGILCVPVDDLITDILTV